ncbi:response regulator [Hahella sp. KA22]|uniref:response regulator n=1 Tax=Hahella sp. KA22 TaxID=1628392 RepID=UPI000FDCF689|nr:response regulator [Hahella sp. KA22]AZZ94743.1 response regulator [Hahella sp. KA22]QAY58117.1 response regulator [Hahella sp. KA22]
MKRKAELPSAQKSTQVRNGYVLRVIACMIVLCLHIAIFKFSGHPLMWGLIVLHTLIYPHLAYFFSESKKQELDNILVDSFAYGACVALWGFNPLITLAFICGAWMTNLAADGAIFFFKGIVANVTGALLTGLITDFYFRPSLELTPTLIASAGLFGYTMSLGMLLHRINLKLNQTKLRLLEQKESLIDISSLAHAVNTHLELDLIMGRVMQALRRIQPFEQVYITLFEDNLERLVLVKSYGDALTAQEVKQSEGFTFFLPEDENSIFVRPLVQDEPLFIPRVPPPDATTSKVDKRLYDFRAPISIAYFPLHVDNKVIGGFGFVNYVQPLDLDAAAIESIAEYLVQVGTAVRNAQLFEQARQAKEQALNAQRAAEVSEAAKSRFLANMSHEIRTPMTAILGYSESLRESNLSREERNQFIDIIVRSGRHLLTIINDILDLSKIEAEKIEIEHMQISLPNLIEDLRSHIGMRAHEKGLTLDITPKLPLPAHFESDPTRLKQILFNLGANATKFTHKGSIHFGVSYEKNANLLRFTVTDTGIGLGPGELKKIFEPFVQADSSTTRQYGGTGLGLYISRQLAHMLGGELTVDSSQGEGSRFSVTINAGDLSQTPWINSLEEFEKARQRLELNGAAWSAPRLRGKVLLAEDNLDNQTLFHRFLVEAGLSVTLASNGKQAVEAASASRFDLILLDIQMPEMGGDEAIQHLRELSQTPPVIALTANVMRHQLDEYRQLGFIDFIAKPVDRLHFYQKLRLYLPTVPEDLTGRILVAEDNDVNRLLFKRQIERIGPALTVVTVENGQEALEAALAESFDLILMDIQMPVMDGLEALRALRAQGYTQPVYIISGNTEPADIATYMESGAQGYLGKPLDRNQLDQLLQELLGHCTVTAPQA